jgi:hypothetical protein
MWNLISLKEQSKMKMVEVFYTTNEPITINTLSELTNTSNRSVKNYLEELKETMSEIGGEFYSSTEGVNFKIPIHIGVDYFQRQLFRNSLGFTLLEKVFFNESLTNDQLINELYISQSTLNRIANTINEDLKPYGLKLETAPYKITGDEQLIRNFYTTYFVEAYSANEWPFECLEKDIIDDILPSASDYYESTSELMNYIAFRFQFAVGVVRNLQGYSIKKIFLENKTLAATSEKLSTEIEKNFDDVSFGTTQKKDSYVSELVINQLLLSNQVLHKRLQYNQDFKERLEDIKQMIHFLTEHFEFPVEDQTNLIIEIDNALTFFSISTRKVQPKMYLLHPPRDYFLVELYQRKYSTFYDMVQQHMSLLCEKRGFEPTDATLGYLIYLLISKWKDLTKHLFNRYNAINVKVYSHLSFRHAQGIAESLISDLPDSINVSVLEEVTLNEEILSKYDFDILISAETLMLDIKQPIVYMYKSRSSYQYEQLHQLIREAAKQKEKVMREKFIKKLQVFPTKPKISIEQNK